jgi:2-polyprenyl-3-methyl-5-hydroxy-6-metoxy-1,4-benzoquinol methylase
MLYRPEGVRACFDSCGIREWDRLERALQGRIKYAIHRRYLEAYVPEGARVLDVGCGPGRFSLDLARRGAQLTLADLSQVQLDMARQKLEAAGLLQRVQALHRLDMVAMPELEDERYEAVVCYGAVLSYTYDCYEAALRELERVLAPGGWLLISVCSLYGALRLVGPLDAHAFLELPDTHIDWGAVTSGAEVVCSRPGSPEFHQPLALFTSVGLRQALERLGLQVVEMAAANPVVSERAQIPGIVANAQAAAALTALELALCNRPGLVDTGEHLLAVARKPCQPIDLHPHQ